MINFLFSKRIKKRPTSMGAWFFIGKDPVEKSRIDSLLDPSKKYTFARQFQEITETKREAFLDSISTLGDLQRDKIIWYSLALSYKNPLSSDVMYQYCLIELLKKLDAEENDYSVVFEDSELIPILHENFPEKIKNNCLSRGKVALRIIWALFSRLRKIRQIIHTGFLLGKKPVFKGIAAGTILFRTWYEFSEDEDGFLFDRYFPNIKKFVKGSGINYKMVTFPFLENHPFTESKKHANILYINQFIDLRMLWKAFRKSLFIFLKLKKTVNGSIKINEIVKHQLRREDILLALCYYYAYEKLFRTQGENIKMLVVPFENQPYDKLLSLAKKNSSADFPLYGQIHSSISRNLINYYQTDNECEDASLDEIWVGSKLNRDLISNNHLTHTIKVTGSFRFGKPENLGQYRNNLDTGNALVVSGYSFSDTLDFFGYLIKNNQKHLHYYLKPHPNIDQGILKKLLGDLPENISFADGSMNDWFPKISLVIHNGTTAAIEAVLQGIKVYKFISESIDLDPIPGTGIEQVEFDANDSVYFNSDPIADADHQAEKAAAILGCPISEEMFYSLFK